MGCIQSGLKDPKNDAHGGINGDSKVQFTNINEGTNGHGAAKCGISRYSADPSNKKHRSTPDSSAGRKSGAQKGKFHIKVGRKF